jgi:3-oxoacyl-(acyl-carrier-protein) synthase III
MVAHMTIPTDPGSGFGIGITRIAGYAPSRIQTNAEVSQSIGMPSGWIEERTGIKSRTIAGPGEMTSDLAAAAGRRLISDGLADPDLLVLATTTPDRPTPSTAATVQTMLGIPGAAALDVNAACSGFLYALTLAWGAINTGVSSTALVIGADTFTRHVDVTNRRTAPLFGDGAGAVVLERVPEGYGILACELWADGNLSDAAYVDSTIIDTRTVTMDPFSMDGRAVKNVVLKQGPEIIGRALQKTGLEIHDLNRVIVHQANPRLVESLAQAVGIEPHKVPTYGRLTGNTAAASVPLTLHRSVQDDPLKRGDIVGFVAIGAGMTGAAVIARWY